MNDDAWEIASAGERWLYRLFALVTFVAVILTT